MTDSPQHIDPAQELTTLLGDRYQLIKQIGEGGTSQVYEAEHQLTGEKVALKIIPLKRVGDKKTVARFLREAKLTQGLSHPGFVQILDAWIDSDQRCCLVMERLYGSSLRELTSYQALSRAGALDMISAVLEPLEIAHREGIVHRDLKPENIFIHHPEDQGEAQVVKLLDFGLSRSVLSPTVTHTGQFVGTPWYISPEQAFSPKQCEASSDIWSVGVILYELLCDRVPFEGESLPMICMAIKQDPHTPITELNPFVHPELAQLIDRCLSKDPAQRPQDAGELRLALRSVKRFKSQHGAEVVSSGAIRGTPETLDIDSSTSGSLPSGSASLAFGETVDHDTSAELQREELEELSERAERGLTVPLSTEEIAERLKALDDEMSDHDKEALERELELGPTAVGTLKAIDWPDDDLPEVHVLDTQSMTARDDLLKLIDDPLEADYLDSDAVTVQGSTQEQMSTLRGAPQAMWTVADIREDTATDEEELAEEELAEASDVISVVQARSDEPEALGLSKRITRDTEALSSKHGPPPTLLGAPNVSEEVNIHDEETSVSALSAKKTGSVDPNAMTQRKARSPFAGQTMGYQDSEITPIIDEEQAPRVKWSQPVRRSELNLGSTHDLPSDALYHQEEPKQTNPFLVFSVLIFIAALVFALWSAIS